MALNEKISEVFSQIRTLEDELQDLLSEQQSKLNFELHGRQVAFENSVKKAHRKLRQGLLSYIGSSSLANILSAPFIYGLIVPFAILDLGVSLYQAICFRLYKIPRVPRHHFIVIDRHHLGYLNALEKLNCMYCGYANGLIAYVREIAARTEQYWCPIKHARRLRDRHAHYADFLDYGDPSDLKNRLGELRDRIQKLDDKQIG